MGGAVPWRMTEAEFEEKLDKYLDKKVEELDFILKERYYETNKKKYITIRSLIRSFYDTQYLPEKREYGVRILGGEVKDWVDISLDSETSLEELMLRFIAGELYNEQLVCISFLCNNKNITEEFIDDIQYVGSGLFSFDEWNDEHKNVIISYIDNTYASNPNSIAKNNKELLKWYDKDRIPLHIRDRIDWKNLPLYRFSNNFKSKHKNLILKSLKQSVANEEQE